MRQVPVVRVDSLDDLKAFEYVGQPRRLRFARQGVIRSGGALTLPASLLVGGERSR